MFCRQEKLKIQIKMACSKKLYFIVLNIIVLFLSVHGKLSSNFYSSTCPNALNIVKQGIAKAIKKDARVGASILRLHFHDCFVNVSSYVRDTLYL